jgi:hypothetical protein
MFPACQIPILRGLSCFVYQEEVNSATPGRNGPSVNPTLKKLALRAVPSHGTEAEVDRERLTKKRQTIKPAGLLIAGIEMVTQDQPSITQGKRMRGLPLAMTTFAGT